MPTIEGAIPSFAKPEEPVSTITKSKVVQSDLDSVMYMKLESAISTGDYDSFFKFLKLLSPSSLDAEIRMLPESTFPDFLKVVLQPKDPAPAPDLKLE